MSRISGCNTKPEVAVRRILHSMGFRFRLHQKQLPGNPDIVLSRHRKIVFVHGCFWHGHENCSRGRRPASNVEFWNTKIDSNIKRDAVVFQELHNAGWEVLTVWQCETRKHDELVEKLASFMRI